PSKEVNLKISTKGNVSNGSTLKSLTPEIENIMIYGKKADLDEIDEISSDPIDLSEINESTEMNVKLDVPDNVSISQKKVKVEIDLGKYFGTDGIRGIANEELTPEIAYKIARISGSLFTQNDEKAKVLIGNDSRISAHMFEGALIAGFLSVGVEVMRLGVIS